MALPSQGLLLPENDPRQRNPHSLPGYRAIQFTARQRITVTPKGRRRLVAARMVLEATRRKTEEVSRRIESILEAAADPARAELQSLLADAQEGVRALQDAERRVEPGGIEDRVTFFFPYEVHILDAASDEQNEAGPSSHALYKERQREAARRRVLGRLLPTEPIFSGSE